MPDVQGKLDEIITVVETAKGKALSGSAAVIDRSALLNALEQLRQLLPAEMSEARSLLRERDDLKADSRAQADLLLDKARVEADRMIETARLERDRLLTESALIAEARRVAAEIRRDAEAEARRMREQTDGYIDASLARFEDLLTGSLDAVARGRARVAGSRAETDEEQDEPVPIDEGPEAGPPEGNGNSAASSGEVPPPHWEADVLDSEGADVPRIASPG